MNDHTTRPRVLEIVAIIIPGQKRINHSDDRADARGAKPCPNKFGAIGQDNQDSIFHLNADGTQSVSGAIAHPRGFAISVSSIFEVETDIIFATFLQVVIEEIVSHVESFGKLDRHVSWYRTASGSERDQDSAFQSR